MDIGIGLPTTLPGTTGDQAVEWARRADAAGFSSLGTIDRLVYPNYEPLVIFPCDPDPAQVDLLADALGMG